MHPTPHENVNVLLDSLLSSMRRVFQERLVGLYLYGSLTTDDFDPEISDVDLLAVTSSTMTAREFEALRAIHRDIASASPEWEDRIDVAYLPVAALRTFRSARSPIAVISPGEPFHMRDEEALRDWLQNWYVVRESGVTLFGPSPKDIIPLIAWDEFVQAVRDYAVEVSERVKGQRRLKSQAYAILTMCRALYAHKMGKRASKRQAALWARKELPQWSRLIQDALEWREAFHENLIGSAATHAETVRFVSSVRRLLLS